MGKLVQSNILKYDQTAANYATHVPGATEVVRQTLYDTLVYDGANGQTELKFFQTQKGQGGKTFADTNLEVAGTLPAGKSFLIEGISLMALPAHTINGGGAAGSLPPGFADDIYSFGANGHLELFISSKTFLEESPLMKFPPRSGVSVDTAVSTGDPLSVVTIQYASISGEEYDLAPANLMLIPTTNFNINLKWPVALALPSLQDMRIVCTLHGIMYRYVQ